MDVRTCLAAVSGSVAFIAFRDADPGLRDALSEPRAIVAIVATVLTVVVLTFYRRAPVSMEQQSIGESRERLTRAESALEQALRDRRRITADDVDIDTQEVSEDVRRDAAARTRAQPSSLGLPELWEATHARLTLYHDIATGQAKTSFRNAQVSMAVGFVLLLVFVVLALNASTTVGALVAGGLGAVSAALSGFISRTFIRSQEAAATHLRTYFDQPLELSRYLAAERLIADGDLIPKQRAEVLSSLVQAMVAPLASVGLGPGQQGP